MKKMNYCPFCGKNIENFIKDQKKHICKKYKVLCKGKRKDFEEALNVIDENKWDVLENTFCKTGYNFSYNILLKKKKQEDNTEYRLSKKAVSCINCKNLSEENYGYEAAPNRWLCEYGKGDFIYDRGITRLCEFFLSKPLAEWVVSGDYEEKQEKKETCETCKHFTRKVPGDIRPNTAPLGTCLHPTADISMDHVYLGHSTVICSKYRCNCEWYEKENQKEKEQRKEEICEKDVYRCINCIYFREEKNKNREDGIKGWCTKGGCQLYGDPSERNECRSFSLIKEACFSSGGWCIYYCDGKCILFYMHNRTGVPKGMPKSKCGAWDYESSRKDVEEAKGPWEYGWHKNKNLVVKKE